jgi:hypothetical protein
MQRGEKPPGIKEVENKLSVDAENPSESKLAARPKPWEVKKEGGGAATATPTQLGTPAPSLTASATSAADTGMAQAMQFLTNPQVSD